MLYLLHQAVDRAAEKTPEHEAICYSGQRLTYAALSEQSDRLAYVLHALGVKRGDRVGMCMNKSLNTPVALYGIMKAGAVFVPLDPSAPAARLAFIIRDCGIRHVITESSKAGLLREFVYSGIDLQSAIGLEPGEGLPTNCVSCAEVSSAPNRVPDTGIIEQDPAYILYTSGSTGTPKGVVHTHRSALSFAEIAVQTFGFESSDRLSNHAPLHFDLSTLDYYSAAIAGATTVIVPEVYTKFPASLSKLMQDERLTVFYSVPFALIQLLQYGALDKRDLSALRWVIFGGEPFPTGHLRRLMESLPGARFCNMYGPTEVNGCTYHILPTPPNLTEDSIPIGRLFGNVQALVVGEDDEPVPYGEVGELLVRSPTMMQGYWGRPDLNTRAFCRRPGVGPVEEVYHRTGDLVRWDNDGNLLFLGRKDRQVKVRGYRIELDEIEAALYTHDAVESAAVLAVQGDDGSKHLEAVVVLKPGSTVQPAELVRHVSSLLPPYAVPEKVGFLRSMPRTSTGKVDRIQLQALARNGSQEWHTENRTSAISLST
jgi:amino acid adenylation domain-containing protein